MEISKSATVILTLTTVLHVNLAANCGFDCQVALEQASLQDLQDLQTLNLWPSKIKKNPKVVKFYFYDRNNSHTPEIYVFEKNNTNMFSSFRKERQTKIIIHGWKAYVPSLITRILKNAYLSFGDYNLIMVDWSSVGSLGPYTWAKTKVRAVASQVAKLIAHLKGRYGLCEEDLHLIGHSMGAHIAGVTGRFLNYGKIGRITGLDPAGPLFDFTMYGTVLSKSSAKFVDVVHTCGGYLGVLSSIGHVDFYPNGGVPIQPGCGLDLSGACSHMRSYAYYAESISNPKGFVGKRCNHMLSCLAGFCNSAAQEIMGEHVNVSARGTFYLKTNNREPFGIVRTSS